MPARILRATDLFHAPLPGMEPSLFNDPTLTPIGLGSLGLPDSPTFADPAITAMFAPPRPSLVNPGDALAIGADTARRLYGMTGKGITIGILSDSFNATKGTQADVLRGDLNAGTVVLKEGPAGSRDEGRAMAELIHKVAPDARILFYSAFHGAADFANGITALAAAGANIIVDDVTYLGESFYQQGGAIAASVAQVVAHGVSYFTAAGNQGTHFDEAAFSGLRATLPGISGTYFAENFGTAARPVTLQSLTIARGATATIDLQWDRPFASIGGTGSATSLGMVLYDGSNRVVAYALRNAAGGDPVQLLQFTNTTAGTAFRLAILTNGGTSLPGRFKYIAYGQGITINDPNAGHGSGSIIGHEEVAAANTVGAVPFYGTARFGGGNTLEGFSSVGPGQFLFDAAGNRLAAPLAPGGVDFLAADGATTNVFAPFFGTSAAAPNAAAVAALMLQANPTLTPGQVSGILAATAASASGAAGGVGAGLIQAPQAVAMAKAMPGAATHAIVSTPGLSSVQLALNGGNTTVVRSGLGAAVGDALATLAQDLGAAAPFTAGLDLSGGLIAPDVQAPPAAGAMAYALLNDTAAPAPVDTSHTLFG